MAAARIRLDLASKREVEATFSGSNGPQTVLVVDPDLKSRSLLQSRLSAEGYVVSFASSAHEALKLLGPGRPLPSIVVAEAELPGDDGFELCACIRADGRTAALPVVLLSRTTDGGQKSRASSVGADDFLARPVFANDVVALVRLLSGGLLPNADILVDTDELALHRVVRALLSGVRSGRLDVDSGYLSFRDGRVVDARFQKLVGAPALSRLLLLTQGEYSVSFGIALGQSDFSVGLEEFCRRFEPAVIRFGEVLARALPIDALLGVDFQKLAEHLHQLPDEVNALVRMFDGRRTVRDVVMQCTFSEITTLEAATRLYLLGVLAPLLHSDDVTATPKLAPRFMEPQTEAVRALDDLFGAAQPPAPELSPVAEPDWNVNRMSPELQAQLDAFGVKEVVEPTPVSTLKLSQMDVFAAGVDSWDRSLEDALNESLVNPDALPEQLAAPVTEAELDFEVDVAQPQLPAEVTFFAKPESDDELAKGLVRGPMFGALTITLAAIAIAGGLALTIGRAAQEPVVKPAVIAAAPVVMEAPAVVVAEGELPSLEQGIAFYEAGFMDDAVGLLETVVLREDSAPAWSMLSLARFEAGDIGGAEMAAKKTLELNAGDGQARMLLATIYIDEREHALADEQLELILELDPKGAQASEARELLNRKRLPKKAAPVSNDVSQ